MTSRDNRGTRRRPVRLRAGRRWHFNVIYNNAKSKLSRNDDTRMSLELVEFLIRKLENNGYDRSYYPDRDALPGGNIFDELFEVIEGSEFTIVILTPSFLHNYWAKYCQLAAFKNLLENANSYKLIPILVEVDISALPKNLSTNRYLSFTKDDWKTDEREWGKLLRLMEDKEFIPETGQIAEIREMAANLQFVQPIQESGRVEKSPYQRVDSQPASNEASLTAFGIPPSNSDNSLQFDAGDSLQVADADGGQLAVSPAPPSHIPSTTPGEENLYSPDTGPDEETSLKVPLTPPSNLQTGQPCPLQEDISSPTVSLKGTKKLTTQNRITPEGAPLQQGGKVQQGPPIQQAAQGMPMQQRAPLPQGATIQGTQLQQGPPVQPGTQIQQRVPLPQGATIQQEAPIQQRAPLPQGPPIQQRVPLPQGPPIQQRVPLPQGPPIQQRVPPTQGATIQQEAQIQQRVPLPQGATIQGTPLQQDNDSSNAASRQTPVSFVPKQEQTDTGVHSSMVDSIRGSMDYSDLTMDNPGHSFSGASVSSSDMKASDFVYPDGRHPEQSLGSKHDKIQNSLETDSSYLSTQDVKLMSTTQGAEGVTESQKIIDKKTDVIRPNNLPMKKSGRAREPQPVKSSDSGVFELSPAPPVAVDSLFSQESETFPKSVDDGFESDQTERTPPDGTEVDVFNEDNQGANAAESKSMFHSFMHGLSITTKKEGWANVTRLLLRQVVHSISNPNQVYLGN